MYVFQLDKVTKQMFSLAISILIYIHLEEGSHIVAPSTYLLWVL